jgi:hypothetical protein
MGALAGKTLMNKRKGKHSNAKRIVVPGPRTFFDTSQLLIQHSASKWYKLISSVRRRFNPWFLWQLLPV